MTPQIGEIAESYKVVILEGPDGSGKTTMAKSFSDEFGFRYVHRGISPGNTNLFGAYHDLFSDSSKSVYDRSFISELVYGPLFRQKSRLELQEAMILSQMVATRGGVLLYVVAEIDVIMKRIESRGSDHWDREQIEAILHQYEGVIGLLSPFIPTFRVDTT